VFPMSALFHSGRRTAGVIAACGLLALSVAACGSSSSSTTGGSGSSGTTVASSGSTSSSDAQYTARLNLAKCLRSHGLNVPDPSTSGGAAGGGGMFKVLAQYPRSTVQAAMQACSQYLRGSFQRPTVSAAQQAQFEQDLVKFAQCMRSHGVNVPDPSTNGSGGYGFGQTFRSADRNSPAFKAAEQACSSLRPHFGNGTGGAGAGAGAGGPGA
jgi:hypothetical protein